ncbi:M20/M25/M40 family metallo-hydrolase [Falsochrobactrum shanghaiense]|nr:M20/M25/M40 family metallo-hydrolase [Falsochrobactrum shanghaiense]
MNDYLDREDVRENNIRELIELLRMPTVSARGDMKPMQDAADWLVKRLQSLGAKTQLLDSPGFPIVYGEIKGDSDKTILFYNHYDVQPVEPLDAWASDPFEPEIRDGILFARGTDDNKGCLLSRIHAVEAILKERGTLPVTVKFIFEGEEESGSESLPVAVERHHELLRADACIWENARRDDTGAPTTTLGNKGMFSFEMRARTATSDSHSGKANIYPNAIWRLVSALSTMRDVNGNITIDGMMEELGELTEAEAEICHNTPANGEKQARKLGLERLIPGNDDFSVNKALFYTPSLNLQGIEGGYTGPGHKTVNPATAMARLECRLVKNQDHDKVKEMIEQHLVNRGFSDIEVASEKAGAWPAYTSPDDPFVNTIVSAARKVYGRELVVLPSSPGTGPRFIFTKYSDMPIAALGVGHADSRAHAPNENIAVEDQHLCTKHVAQILREWAQTNV